MGDRGRSFSSRFRGRSQSRGRGRGFNPAQHETSSAPPPPPPNYANPDLIRQLTEDKVKLEQRLAQNEQLAKAAETKPKPAKRDQLIEEGKEVMNKFFKGFHPVVRGNVKVTLDSTFVNRVVEPYYEKLDQIVYDMNDEISDPNELEELQERYCKRLNGATDIATAIKLYKSAPEGDQDRMFYFSSIHKSQISLPKKLGVIINQLGKTDLNNDNKIRIVGQDLVAKRHLARGVMRYSTKAEMVGYMKLNANYDEFNSNLTSRPKFDGMIDISASSVVYIQNIIQQKFDKLRAQGHEVIDGSGQTCIISFPPFDFEKATPETLKRYASNPIFKIFAYAKNKDVYKVAACTALSLIDLRWLKNLNASIGTILGGDKTGTDFDSIVVGELLNWLDFWVLDNYIEHRDLNELASMVISNWNGSIATRLKTYIKMENISFSEYGSDSQLVEVDEDKVSKNVDGTKEYQRRYHGITLNVLKGKAKSWVKQKISDSGAIIGSMVKFNSNVEYIANWEIGFEGNNRNILREFLKTDFM